MFIILNNFIINAQRQYHNESHKKSHKGSHKESHDINTSYIIIILLSIALLVYLPILYNKIYINAPIAQETDAYTETETEKISQN
jgi:hypothetical protein